MNTQWRKPIQLILIEDDAAIAAAINRACTTAGVNYQMTRFQNGGEALAALQGALGRTLQTKPYLILLDLDLQDGSGIACLDVVRADAMLRRSIIFALSAATCDEDKAVAYDRRVAGYLVKSGLDNDYTALCDLLDVYERSIQFPLG